MLCLRGAHFAVRIVVAVLLVRDRAEEAVAVGLDVDCLEVDGV